jgi:hypothetical protein
MHRVRSFFVAASAALTLLACSSSKAGATHKVPEAGAPEAGDSGADACVDGGAGTLTATFSNASGSNANTAAFGGGTISATASHFGERSELFITSDAAAGSTSETVSIAIYGPPVVGQAYALTSSASIAQQGSAAAYYQQVLGADAGAKACWVSGGGTLTISAYDGCTVTFKVSSASMAPSTTPSGPCTTAAGATGTFTMNTAGAGDPISH